MRHLNLCWLNLFFERDSLVLKIAKNWLACQPFLANRRTRAAAKSKRLECVQIIQDGRVGRVWHSASNKFSRKRSRLCANTAGSIRRTIEFPMLQNQSEFQAKPNFLLRRTIAALFWREFEWSRDPVGFQLRRSQAVTIHRAQSGARPSVSGRLLRSLERPLKHLKQAKINNACQFVTIAGLGQKKSRSYHQVN